MRDFRTLNQSEGQKIESDEVLTRIGDLSYRNIGSVSKVGLFNSGKALITEGLRVEPSTGMTVSIPSGVCFQRQVDVAPIIHTEAQTVTLDAASGIARVDIIEAQIKSIADKVDVAAIGTVSTGTEAGTVVITNETINRDIKYYLDVRKQTNTTTPTAATAGTLTGTVAIPGTIDLSEDYLINISDGEDGDWMEIDCRGATPEATTGAEIVSNFNTAVGRTIASIGGGNVMVLTGEGTGKVSQFAIKPPNTDADADALNTIFGVSSGGAYKYLYQGTDEWFKLAEIDVGASTTTITTSLIRNLDRKSTWASGITDIIVRNHIYQQNISSWNEWSSTVTYSSGNVTYIDDIQFVSLQNSNLNNNPLTSPNYWEIAPNFEQVLNDYQRGLVIWPGIKNIDDYRNGSYETYYFSGYYEKGNKSFEAYHIHLDGSQVDTDSTLVDILDIDGSNEYFALETLAPDQGGGTRYLPDARGKTLRAVDDDGGDNLTEDVGEIQEDQFQGHAIQFEEATGGTFRYPIEAASFGGGSAEALVAGASGSVSNQQWVTDGTNGTPRYGIETRVKNLTIGVPYIIVLKEV